MLELNKVEKLVKGKPIKVGELDNQIYYDGRVLFAYMENGKEMFEVLDGYPSLEEAVEAAKLRR